MSLTTDLAAGLDQLRDDKVYKQLNYLDSPQGPRVRMEGRGEVLILSSNNYLGLANDPVVVEAGSRAYESSEQERQASASSAARSRSIVSSSKR